MKTVKKMLRSFLALILVFGCLSCGMVVHAAGKIKLAPQILWAGAKEVNLVYQNATDDFRGEAKLVSVKSKNTKVIKVVRDKDSDDVEDAATLTAVKAGTSKITATYKYKGKKTTISATYTVKKTPKPFASITIAGKKLNLKKDPCGATLKLKGDEDQAKQIKVQVKFNKGWKLKRMYRMDDGKEETVKNGKIAYTGDERIGIVAVNKKKVTMTYEVWIYDPSDFG